MPTECLPSTEFVLAREHTRGLGLRMRAYLQNTPEHHESCKQNLQWNPNQVMTMLAFASDRAGAALSCIATGGLLLFICFNRFISMTVTADLVIPWVPKGCALTLRPFFSSPQFCLLLWDLCQFGVPVMLSGIITHHHVLLLRTAMSHFLASPRELMRAPLALWRHLASQPRF